MVGIKLRYVHQDRDRHGTVRYYFRRKVGAPKIRLPARPGDADFHNRYCELLQGTAAGRPEGITPTCAPLAGTLRWLAVEYFKASAFRQLNPSTQGQRRRILEGMLLEPTRPGAALLYGDVRLRAITTKGLRVLRDRAAHRRMGRPEDWQNSKTIGAILCVSGKRQRRRRYVGWRKSLRAASQWPKVSRACDVTPLRAPTSQSGWRSNCCANARQRPRSRGG